MKIRILEKNHFLNVEVRDRDCKKRSCLVIGHYTHRSITGASGCSNWTDANLSCLTRDNHGCPEKIKL